MSFLVHALSMASSNIWWVPCSSSSSFCKYKNPCTNFKIALKFLQFFLKIIVFFSILYLNMFDAYFFTQQKFRGIGFALQFQNDCIENIIVLKLMGGSSHIRHENSNWCRIWKLPSNFQCLFYIWMGQMSFWCLQFLPKNERKRVT